MYNIIQVIKMSVKTKTTYLMCIPPVITLFYGIFAGKTGILLNSCLVILCVLSALILDKRINLFSNREYGVILIFILCSVFAGRSLGAYKSIPYWDKILHFLSGFILLMVGKNFYRKLNGNKNKIIQKLFTLFSAISGAALWEIFEFGCDSLLGTMAQNNSLNDTMWDLILGTLSTISGIFFI